MNYKAVGGRWTNEPHRGTQLYNTIEDLEPNTEYQWAVRAENSAGTSVWVHADNFTTLGDKDVGAPEIVEEDTSVYLVSVPTNGGSTTVGGTWDTTGKATLTAYPNHGYDFQRWTENGVTLSTDRVYVMEVTGIHEVSAHFSVNQDRGKWNVGQTYTDYYFPKGAYESLAWTFVSVVDPPESLSEEGLLHYYAYNFSLVNSTREVGRGYAGFQSNGLFRGRAKGKVINYSIWGSNGGKTDGLLESDNTESGGHQIMYPFEWIEGLAYRFELREGPSGLDALGKWWGLWVEDVATGSVTFVGEQRVPSKINGRDATMWEFAHARVRGRLTLVACQ